MTNRRKRSPWLWLSTLSFAGSVPYVMLTIVSLVVLKQMRLGNADIMLYTSWLYLPWILRPLWEPIVRQTKDNRWWVLLTEALIGAAFGGLAFTIPARGGMQATMFFFWLMAFACAFHQSAASRMGHSLQRASLSIRSLSNRLGVVLMQGVLVMLAGNLQVVYRNSIRYSWCLLLYGVMGLMLALWLWHLYALRNPSPKQGAGGEGREKRQAAFSLRLNTRPLTFVRSLWKGVGGGYLLTFWIAEGLLTKMATLFLIDPAHRGGLGLSPQEYGLVLGTVGVFGLCVGNILGVHAIRRHGLKRWKWPMAFAAILPAGAYYLLSQTYPETLLPVCILVFVEQLCHGFGITAYMMTLSRLFRRHAHTLHPTVCQSMAALTLMLTGILAGTWQQAVGYRQYFFAVMLASLAVWAGMAASHLLYKRAHRMTEG